MEKRKLALFIGFLIINAIFWIGEIKFGVLSTVDSKTQQYLAKIASFRIMGEVEEETDGCPKGPIVVSELGHWNLFEEMIWEYTGTWGLAKYLNRTGYVSQSALTRLLVSFPHLTLLPYEDIEHCNISLVRIKEDTEPLDTLVERTNGSSLLFARDTVLPSALLPFIEEAKTEFRFNDSIINLANFTLQSVNMEGRALVGVQLRRTKYYQDMLYEQDKRAVANASFYVDAMEWLRKNVGGKFQFIISADNVQWAMEHVSVHEDADTVVVPRDDHRDIVLFSQMDHLILDYGNIAAWGSMFCDGYIVSLLPIGNNIEVISKYKKYVLFDDSKYMDRIEKV